MSRYTDFSEDNQNCSLLNDQEQQYNDPVCVKNLLPTPNPLMNKIQYSPYEARNYYPVQLTKLPACLSKHEYHIDRNNMILIDESLFAHEKLKKDFAKFKISKTIMTRRLTSLKEFYSNKTLIYQKYKDNSTSNYFATYVISMLSVGKNADQLNRNEITTRSRKTPLLTDRFMDRPPISCRAAIQFSSNFQSGNLYKVYQRQFNQYDLILQNDINTKGNNQWFFFNVRGVPKNSTVKFNIVNMSKRFSLFQYGMKPAIFSMMKYEKRQIGWVRDGAKIAYRENEEIKKQSSEQPYYSLSFQYRFTYDGDIVYFGYSIPYTFTNLTSFLSNTIANRAHHMKVRIRTLGNTLGGNEVNLFELTNSESKIPKKSIWIMSRQHSGEVTSSFMVEGIVNYLLADNACAQYLLSRFVFKIIPMVNIDGVVHGNTRAELMGFDSNRKWADPHKQYQPIIYKIKMLIQKDNVEMILDLHSHSRKLGTFFYGNHSNELNNLIKIFPMMVCKNDARFDYHSNRFRGGSDLTARNILFNLHRIPFVYTVESSFFGYQREGDFKITPYQPNDYRQMGITILNSLAELSHKLYADSITDERLLLCEQQQLTKEGNLWDKMNQVDDIESMGSDQDPTQDEFSKKQIQLLFPKRARKTGKTKKKRVEVKPKEEKEKKQNKKEPIVKLTQIQKQSYYKKYFSGRCSLSAHTSNHQFKPMTNKPQVETKNFCVQVDMSEKIILRRTSLNKMTPDKVPNIVEKVFHKKSLCVIGQKMEQDLTINDTSVGLQVEMDKIFLKNRAELQTANLSKRVIRSNPKMSMVMLNNQNNFLNRGDILHSVLRMATRR